MTPLSIAVLSLSMSTDAFAAAVGRGAANRPPFATAVRNGLVFGVIEAITPLIGWALGMIAAGFVEQVDHWIAFGLLGAVGAKMLWESFQPLDEETPVRAGRNAILALIATAVGTSIDAAAVGVGLAFIGANIWIIAACIGFTTFVLTTIGMLIGRAVGVRFGKVAEFLGGVALILIGLSILADHMGWLHA
jgi:manganese efflux pump family protein